MSSFLNDILCLAAFLAKGVFVKQVFSHAVFRSSHAPQVGHPVCQFFDGLHLLVQEMCLDEITQLKQNINSLERKEWISTRQFPPPPSPPAHYFIQECTKSSFFTVKPLKFSRVDRCDQSTSCASRAETGSRSFQAAGRIQGLRFHCPTHLVLVSATKCGSDKILWQLT